MMSQVKSLFAKNEAAKAKVPAKIRTPTTKLPEESGEHIDAVKLCTEALGSASDCADDGWAEKKDERKVVVKASDRRLGISDNEGEGRASSRSPSAMVAAVVGMEDDKSKIHTEDIAESDYLNLRPHGRSDDIGTAIDAQHCNEVSLPLSQTLQQDESVYIGILKGESKIRHDKHVLKRFNGTGTEEIHNIFADSTADIPSLPIKEPSVPHGDAVRASDTTAVVQLDSSVIAQKLPRQSTLEVISTMIQKRGGSLAGCDLGDLYLLVPSSREQITAAGGLAAFCKASKYLEFDCGSRSVRLRKGPNASPKRTQQVKGLNSVNPSPSTKPISTQTADGAEAVRVVQQLLIKFRGRSWPGSKAELISATGKPSAKLKPLVAIWKTSGWLTGKGTKKHEYVWKLTAIPTVGQQTQVPSALASEPIQLRSYGPLAIQYVDTVEKLEAALAYITASIRGNAVEETPMQDAGAIFEPEPTHDAGSCTEKRFVIAVGAKAGSEGLSLLQVGISTVVFLIDCVALASEPDVFNLMCYATGSGSLSELLANDDIIKFAFDIHQTAYLLAQDELTADVELVRALDIQLAIEQLTSDPNRSFTECISQLNSEGSSQPATAVPGVYGRSTKADASFDVRPLSPATRERAAKEMRDLLGVAPRLLQAVGDNVDALIAASDLRAAAGAASLSGSRRIAFDVANGYSMASPELMQTMRPQDMLATEKLVVSNDTDVLLDLLPTDLANELRHTDEGEEDLTIRLSDIVLDKGRPACAWVDGERINLGADGRTVTIEEIEAVTSSLGGFGSDNRAGLEQQLHRISAMKNRYGDTIGLTMRVGRHVSGNADMISDLLFGDDRSILFLGEPGSGKTTIVREATRLLASEMNVCVVDTSNEIAGDGDVPHPCIGLARRMMVPSLDAQADVMVECVQNHTPEVMVIDEIGRPAEVEAARTCKQRGVRMIASAHGDLRKLVKNKQIRGLVGGVETVTLGDEAAKNEAKKKGMGGGIQKMKAQRQGSATFDIIVELRRGEQHEWRIILDAGKAVDAILEGQQFSAQRRTRDAESGAVELTVEGV